ncbi:hybrid sensor histidine kinase/response regulator [Verrucomicrobia bacterium LW23]|nr:hybrid sensor histidine kinase/response regulator [Verrucomicrobia bacterium LW23]
MANTIPMPPHQRLAVLLVEDNVEDAELVIRELRRAGYEAKWHRVDNDVDFIAALSNHNGGGNRPDIILSDYHLPGFDVMWALQYMRENGIDIPFILLSGVIGEEMAVAAIREGAEDYLLKDRLGRLGVAVRQAIERCTSRHRRAQSEVALRESEELFRQVVENIQEVFWMADPHTGKLLFVSPVCERVWGRTREQLYADSNVWPNCVHPDDRERVHNALRRNLTHAVSEEYRIVRPDGTVRRIHARAFPVRREDGEVHRIVGVAADITERCELEEHYRQAQKMEAIGQLAGGVAHDFNNILTIIEGYTNLLQQRSIDPVDAANEISHAVERASALTRQLLTFSRKQVMQVTDLDLNAIVAEIARMLKRTLTEDISLTVRTSPELPLIHGDPNMMEQILMNLALNARDAMPGGGHLTITTAPGVIAAAEVHAYPEARPGSAVCLTVRDTGCGIPPENMQRIFEPFFTTKDVNKGTGLGLPNVHGIVRQHRGCIRLYSEVGAGTSVQILIPTAANAAQPAAPRAPRQATPVGGRETILLVEDEASLRMILRMALSRIGYNVIEASSGIDALSIIADGKHSPLDIVVTDIVMPDGMTGQDLARSLAISHPGLPIIFTSGYHSDYNSPDCELKEGVNFLQKPYSPQKLARIIRTSLDKAAGRAESAPPASPSLNGHPARTLK